MESFFFQTAMIDGGIIIYMVMNLPSNSVMDQEAKSRNYGDDITIFARKHLLPWQEMPPLLVLCFFSIYFKETAYLFDFSFVRKIHGHWHGLSALLVLFGY